MWLVDTNVLSEIRKGSRCHPGVAKWVRETPPDSMFISVLVLGEVRRGIERVRRRDPKQASRLSAWLERLRVVFDGRVLEVTETVADAWGAIDSADPIPVIDALLAATAKVNGFTLVTRNVADVETTGAAVFNPFA